MPVLSRFIQALFAAVGAVVIFIMACYLPNGIPRIALAIGVAAFFLWLYLVPQFWYRRLVSAILLVWSGAILMPTLFADSQISNYGFFRLFLEGGGWSLHLPLCLAFITSVVASLFYELRNAGGKLKLEHRISAPVINETKGRDKTERYGLTDIPTAPLPSPPQNGEPELEWSCRDPQLLAWYLQQCAKFDPKNPDLLRAMDNDEEALQSLAIAQGLAFRDDRSGLFLTRVGVLLCARRIRIPASDYHVDVQLALSTGLQKKLRGSILYLYQELLANLSFLFERNLSSPDVRDEQGSETIYFEYPRVAVIEALVNFLIHRDYSEDDIGFINVCSDRIVFTNPGRSLIDPIELMNAETEILPKNANQRNPRLVEAFSRTEINQRRGSGILRIRQSLEKNSLPGARKPPLELRNDESKNRFTLTIWKQVLDPPSSDEALIQGNLMRTAAMPVSQIPEPVEDFVGREVEIASVLEALDVTGTVILGLRGMGGSGKTELAKVFAKRLKAHYPDGQVAFNLHGPHGDYSLAPPTQTEVLQYVIRAFLPEAKLSEEIQTLKGVYRSVLAGRRVLLLMDDALDAAQLAGLIPLPDRCGLIVTSRRRFVLPGMKEIELSSLSHQDARQLLLDICPRIGEHADALAERCGYLPLALRLAGSALQTRKTLEVAAYMEDLQVESDRLSKLDEYRAATEQALGIESSLSIGYRLLDERLQRLWRALAVFPGDFDEAAAASVWELAERQANKSLGDLYAASMVQLNETTRRFHLHELARGYARARLSDCERVHDALRHAKYYLDVLQRSNKLYLEGGDSLVSGLALCDREWPNIRAGQAWASTEASSDKTVARICNEYAVVGTFCLDLRLHSREYIRWLEKAVEAASDLDNAQTVGRHLGNLGLLHADLGEPRKAVEFYEQALAIHRLVGDRRGEGVNLGNLGNVYADLGEPYKAIEFYEQALAIHRLVGDRRGEGVNFGNLGNVYADLGEPRKAIEYYVRALEIDRKIGDQRGEGSDLGNLGSAYATLNEPSKAIGFHEHHLVIAREIGDRRGEGNALGNLGNVYADLGEPHKAIGFYEQQLAIVREIGDRRGEGNALGNLGNVYADLGEPHKAIGFYEQQFAIAREIGDRRGEGNAHYNMVEELVKTGRRDEAIAHAAQAVEIFEQIESPHAADARALLERLNRQE